jgi:hypothetical protein
MAKEQSFENHARTIPLYHGVTFGIFALNLLWQAGRLIRDGFSGDRLMLLLVAIALIILFFFTRIFALTVQDRVIRNEMRARLHAVLPPSLAARVPDLSVAQLVAMRFASDAELPELTERVLAGNIQDKKTIKRMIRHWQADHQRA